MSLERRHIDLEFGTLRLDPGMTKNDDGRVGSTRIPTAVNGNRMLFSGRFLVDPTT